jgi:hypothetical protein
LLPVAVVPEQLLVASMRNDVIDDRRDAEFAFALALDTQWMLLEERGSLTTPAR